ncbi:hypothetical protein ACP70R_006849 [Stipagrostis hirtigluma subsp. patula]
MASSAAALKMAAVCMLVLCVASDLARPAVAFSPPPTTIDQEAAAAALLRELAGHELAGELGLAPRGAAAGQHGDVGDVCSSACQTCLIVCAVTCVLNKEPIACFVNCTVSSTCFGKPVAAA